MIVIADDHHDDLRGGVHFFGASISDSFFLNEMMGILGQPKKIIGLN